MILFIVTLIIAIIIHEAGHLIITQLVGGKVETFSIGFGKPLFSRKIQNITYQICPFLLGGYCKLKGELSYSRSKYAFTNLPYSKKLAIAIAGCAVNIIIGGIGIVLGRWLLNWNLFYFGYLNLVLGITNLLPIPALDGSYPLLVLLENKYGKKKGYDLMEKIVNIGFIIIMILNVLCIPWIILNWKKL
jgi:membrane-associated protease RseP (regulator of RpoE activity)